ncbi:hypothetical protein JTB14_014729 [Gonioctena quinquepunctata]|nr:hypothetical protein JTB14_014729 [Gonioctena quinquepunctata]
MRKSMEDTKEINKDQRVYQQELEEMKKQNELSKGENKKNLKGTVEEEIMKEGTIKVGYQKITTDGVMDIEQGKGNIERKYKSNRKQRIREEK